MGEYFWISNNGSEEVWFLSLEEGVCDQNSTDPDSDTIILLHLGFV